MRAHATAPPVQSLLEERLACPERRWEWSSPEASLALEELRPHLLAPSKAAKLFHTIVWEDAWPTGDVQGMDESLFNQGQSTPAVRALPVVLGQQSKKKEPVRLLVLVTILLAMTLVYNAVNAQRQASMQRPMTATESRSKPAPASHATPFGTQAMRPRVS